MTDVKILNDGELAEITGGDTNNSNRKFFFSTSDYVDVLVGWKYRLVSDGKTYTCSSFENFDKFTRYYFTRTENGVNAMFTIEWNSFGGNSPLLTHS